MNDVRMVLACGVVVWIAVGTNFACSSGGEKGDCKTNDECKEDAYCNENNKCTAIAGSLCADENPCAKDYVCVDGICAAPGSVDLDTVSCSCFADAECTATAPECVDIGSGPECIFDSECDDQNNCTENYCIEGKCTTNPTPQAIGCCVADTDCDDNNACTDDKCGSDLAYHCSNVVTSENCCNDNVECDDLLQCTVDTCEKNECKHVKVNGFCCDTDEQCDDNDL
ncbi:MAG: hypothetical protein HUU55_10350 [Myxococcales bacterium]|nr:hypothetical protein [Myxococcales bacterium]